MKITIGFLGAAILAASLTACGGGGGSPSSVNPAPVATLVPAAVPKTAQRASIQSALTTVRTTTLLSQFGAASGTTTASARRGALHVLLEKRAGRQVQSSTACTNMFTETVTATGPNAETVTDTYYYDAACTQTRELVVANVTPAEIDGSATLYDSSGAVSQYETLKILVPATSGSPVTITVSVAKTASSTPYAAFGLTCTVNSASTALACGAAAYSTLADSSMLGASLTLTGTDTISSTGDSASITETANAYSGSAGALSIAQGAADAWNVNGGSLIGSALVTGTLSATSGGQPTSVAIVATDPTYKETVKLTGSSAGTTITELLGTTTLATASLDLNGNGTITYTDGTQNTVVGYTIVS